jgi:FeS assembly SUF system protein
MSEKNMTPAELEAEIKLKLQTVYDPEIPVNIWELGLIYEVKVQNNFQAYIKMTLTSPHCPAAESLPGEIGVKIKAIPGITGVDVDVVWDPPWEPDMMSEVAKLELGML